MVHAPQVLGHVIKANCIVPALSRANAARRQQVQLMISLEMHSERPGLVGITEKVLAGTLAH